MVSLVVCDIPFGPNTGSALPPGHAPNQVALVDLNGDGVDDAVVPGRTPDRMLRWALGTGSAPAFGAWQELQLDTAADWAIAEPHAGSATDVLVALRASRGAAARLTGAGDGTLAVGSAWAAEREPRTLARADINGDGAADLIIANAAGPSLQVVHGDGAGGYTPAQRRRNDDWFGGLGSLQLVQASDLDRDGWTDVIASSISTGGLLVWRNRGGVLAPWPIHTPVQPSAPDRPAITMFALGDMDDDGDDDLVAQLLSLEAVQPLVICWNDAGSFTRQDAFDGPATGYGWSCAIADLDADGDRDVVSSVALINGGIFLLENVGSARVPAFGEPVLKRPSPFVRHIELADTDGDCDPDIVAVDISSNTLLNLPNLAGCGSLAGVAPVHRAPGWRRAEEAQPLLARGPSVTDATCDEAALPASPRGSSPREVAQALASYALPRPHGARPFADAGSTTARGATGGSPQGSLAGSACGPGDGTAGPCHEPHDTPGCFTTGCCDAVCLVAPECCTVSWDQSCVDIAATECEGMYCPAIGACDQAHDDGGCDEPMCCERTVRLDPWCGDAAWDDACVIQAGWWCPMTPCELEGPPGARDEAEVCYEHLNDGCTLPEPAFDAIACGERVAGQCTTGAPRDTDWFALPPGGLTIGLRAEFPASLTIVRGSCVTTLEQLAWHAVTPCEPLVASICVPQGQSWYAIVSLGGPEGPIQSGQPCTVPDPDHPPDPDDPPIIPGEFGTRYELALSCGACPPDPDLNGDGTVDGADLGILLSAWQSGPSPADLNQDGVVNGADLGVLLSAWR